MGGGELEGLDVVGELDGLDFVGGVVLSGVDELVVETGCELWVDFEGAVPLVLDRSPVIELAENSEAMTAETEAKGTVSETSV